MFGISHDLTASVTSLDLPHALAGSRAIDLSIVSSDDGGVFIHKFQCGSSLSRNKTYIRRYNMSDIDPAKNINESEGGYSIKMRLRFDRPSKKDCKTFRTDAKH